RGQEESVRLAKTDYLPNLNFIGRYELDDDGIFGDGGKSYTLLATATWNVFDGLLTTNNVREARAVYNSARYGYEQARDGVLFEVRRAFYDLKEAGERIQAAGAAAEEGEEVLRIIERRFQSGMAKAVEVLDAEAALTRARVNRLQALYDYNVSAAALMLAVGRMEY
ncbi:MAG TPA: TolC family protein, partial [Nitrospirota bacterium]|nr:TolC family protein [Nitrospirota bacterium]